MQLTIDDLPAAIRDALRADLPGYAATFRELEGDIARQVDMIRRAHAHGRDVIPVVPFADIASGPSIRTRLPRSARMARS